MGGGWGETDPGGRVSGRGKFTIQVRPRRVRGSQGGAWGTSRDGLVTLSSAALTRGRCENHHARRKAVWACTQRVCGQTEPGQPVPPASEQMVLRREAAAGGWVGLPVTLQFPAEVCKR